MTSLPTVVTEVMSATIRGSPDPPSLLSSKEDARLQGLKSGKLQAMAATIMLECQDQINEHQRKINELCRRIRNMRSIYNTGAAINEMMPSEILLQIFRGVQPHSSDFMASIRLTHVCRAWRTLIHHSPLFWVDILDPEVKSLFTDHPQKFPVVLAAFTKSQPIAPLSFSLRGGFLPILASVPEHASRISTLWIDSVEDVPDEIPRFLQLQIPQLEKLTLWQIRCHGAQRTTRDPYPRLSYLRASCMHVALPWITPAMRHLIFGNRLREGEARRLFRGLCCEGTALSDVFEALERCPNLEELEIDYSLADAMPSFESIDEIRLSPLRMERLKVLHLGETPDIVRAILDQVTVPDTTKITLCTGVPISYLPLSDLLPKRAPLAVIPQIRSLTISVDGERLMDHGSSIECEIEPGDQRLSLHAGEWPQSNYSEFDLRAFLKGAAASFSPSNITRLELKYYVPLEGDKYGWSWLFGYHSRVTDLVLDIIHPGDAFVSLAPANVLEHLERLTIVTVAHETSHMVHDAMVSMLERRASRGVRLRALSFTQEVAHSMLGFYPTLTDQHIARLRAVVDELETKTVVFH